MAPGPLVNTKKQGAGWPPAFHVLASYSGRVLVKCMWGAVLVSVSLSMGKPVFPLADRLARHLKYFGQLLLRQAAGAAQRLQLFS